MNSCVILLVDDSAEELMIVTRAIKKSRPDCSIETAIDGSEALLRFKTGKPFSIILLDLKLPGMDGLDILRYIRTYEKTRYTPVVILTSSNLDADMKAAYDAGANGFIHKTHDLAEFTENMKAALHYWIKVNRVPFVN
jgi:two-component system response regulator